MDSYLEVLCKKLLCSICAKIIFKMLSVPVENVNFVSTAYSIFYQGKFTEANYVKYTMLK